MSWSLEDTTNATCIITINCVCVEGEYEPWISLGYIYFISFFSLGVGGQHARDSTQGITHAKHIPYIHPHPLFLFYTHIIRYIIHIQTDR